MGLSSIATFTEESTRQCRELTAFLKKKRQIEQDYGDALADLCQHYQRSAWSGLRPIANKDFQTQSVTGASSTSTEQVLLSMSLWTGVYNVIDHITGVADSHIQAAREMERVVILPLQTAVQEMDDFRKQILEKGRQITHHLQDAYTEYRHAKQEFDAAQLAASEAVDAVSKAQLKVDTRGKRDLDRLQAKAGSAVERVERAVEQLRACEDYKKNAQQRFYEMHLPQLHKEIRAYEQKRLEQISKLMASYAALTTLTTETHASFARIFDKQLAQIDVSKDISLFADVHFKSEERDFNTVSVRSLLNPLKAGRVYVKRGDNSPGWTGNYYVLMAEDRLLYGFDGEDSESPTEIITLSACQVYSVDDSYFGRAHCFQLIMESRPGKADGLGQSGGITTSLHSGVSSVASSGSGKVTYNIIAESANDKAEWIHALRQFCHCCDVCSSVYGTHNYSSWSVDGSESEPAAEGNKNRKLVRSMCLWVMEAKDLRLGSGGKIVSPYCIVLFNDVKQARTGMRSGESPFWGEEFRFSDIPPCRSRLRLLFFNAGGTGKKDSEIGYVSINLSKLKTNKRIEEWYQIRPFSRTSGSSDPVGAVRIAYVLTNEQSLPMALYEEFLEIITEDSLSCARFIGNMLGTQKEEYAKTLIHIFVAHNKDVEGAKTLTRLEIETTDDPNIIFRGNSVATKIVDNYMKLIGTEYLHTTLSSLIKGIYTSKDSCEVDPTRLPQGKEADLLKRHWKRLLNHVTIFWEAIQNSADRCPIELIAVFSDMADAAGRRFPDAKYKYAAVSGFIFLRFFVPAILNPKLFGLMSDHPDAVTARTLTLIAKILQNLANLSEFEGKEPHMAPCNQWIHMNLEPMRAFINRISTPPEGKGTPPCPKPRVDLRRESAILYQCIAEKWETIQPQIRANGDPVLLRLIPIMEKLHAAAQQHQADEDPTALPPVLPPVALTSSSTDLLVDDSLQAFPPSAQQHPREATNLTDEYFPEYSADQEIEAINPLTSMATTLINTSPLHATPTPPPPPLPPMPASAPGTVRHTKPRTLSGGRGGTGTGTALSSSLYRDAVSPLYPQTYQDGLLSSAIAAMEEDEDKLHRPKQPSEQRLQQAEVLAPAPPASTSAVGGSGSNSGTISRGRQESNHGSFTLRSPLNWLRRGSDNEERASASHDQTGSTEKEPAAQQQQQPPSPKQPSQPPPKSGKSHQSNKVGSTLRSLLSGRDTKSTEQLNDSTPSRHFTMFRKKSSETIGRRNKGWTSSEVLASNASSNTNTGSSTSNIPRSAKESAAAPGSSQQLSEKPSLKLITQPSSGLLDGRNGAMKGEKTQMYFTA
ncbi:Ras GTPase-activating protein 1 [Gaertneriomyces sp. JEL0708]|nr:Ras GTPase-activating protein 1 [Gaertneriomyces sp. JEL0708]